jgi:hypothetical protein
MRLIRIPKVFYNDHVARDLPAPPIERKTRRHYYIDCDHPHIGELEDDAVHYSDATTWGNGIEQGGIERSARATLNAIREAG